LAPGRGRRPRRLPAGRLPPHPRPGRGARRHARRARHPAGPRAAARGRAGGGRAAPGGARRRAGPQRRHRGDDPSPPRGLRRADRPADRRLRAARPGAPRGRHGLDRRGHRRAARGPRRPMSLLPERVEWKTPEQIAVMRRSGHLLHRVHDMLAAEIRPGITTDELDTLAHTMIRDEGATPNFLGYQGYPATLCLSVNDVVVHGIPDDRPLEEGDLVSIDGGLIIDGWPSDAARTHVVGEPRSAADAELVRITREALWTGIAALATAQRVGDIGAAIEDFVAEEAGESLSHLEGFGGHGIGSA